MKIIPVDCKYVEESFAAAYLCVKEGRGFFIECNTNHAIPFLLEAAQREGLDPSEIDGLLITHVHLDHAGGAGKFLEVFPRAVLYAHPRAARHAIDPAKLVESATRVYGAPFMQKLYGSILPCPAARVRALEEGERIPFADAFFETRSVRGHANHHVVAYESETGTLFSGDAFGVCYPRFHAPHPLILPSTSPTDFDGAEALKAFDLILGFAPERVALTHYGFLQREVLAEAALHLREQIRISLELVEALRTGTLAPTEVESRLRERTRHYFKTSGVEVSSSDWNLLEVDFRVNAQGLIHAASRG
jgi:glyoxylase-like metal-dependent hydrolase (beta-lactamase superfamily II)